MGTTLSSNIQKQKVKTKPIKLLRTLTRELLAIIFWVYLVVTIFVFNIDSYLSRNIFSGCEWVVHYKFLIILGIIGLFWAITKNSRFANWSLYILFYPFVVVFWRIPTLAIKQKSWNLAFAIINSLISYFKKFKVNFLFGTAFLITSIALVKGSNRFLLWASLLFIFVNLIIHYIRKFIFVIRPSSIFRLHVKMFESVKKMGMKSTFVLTDDIKSLPVQNLNKEQLGKWTQCLQMSVLFNRTCLFFAKKLRDYQKSGLNIASYVLSLLWLIIITVFSFSVLYYGLYKIYPDIFKIEGSNQFFTFFYFGFNNLLYNSIPEISPITPLSQGLVMIQKFFAFFLVAIFISLFISVNQQKHTEELNKVIEGLEDEGKSMESFIQTEYKISDISVAIDELGKVKAGLFNLIFQLSNFINT
jgi:hypothetical protein